MKRSGMLLLAALAVTTWMGAWNLSRPEAQGPGSVNIRGWFGSSAPTVGQKTMADSMPVTVASDQAAVPVSGTVTASGPLTDTQLRATAVPVSGTVTANAGTGTLATAEVALTTITTGQLAVTATAQQLSANTAKLVCLKVIDGGTQNVKYGPTGVTTSTGQELVPGEGACRPASNTNLVYVIAAGTGSTIAWEAWN